MELEDLKRGWRELDERMAAVEARAHATAMDVACERIRSSRARLVKTTYLPMIGVCLLPMMICGVFRELGVDPGPVFYIFLFLFVAAVLVNHTTILLLLRGMDPVGRTVRESCADVLRLRRHFLCGVAVKVTLAVPVIVSLCVAFYGIDPWIDWGMIAGLAVGIAAGVRIFIRVRSDIAGIENSLCGMNE